MKFKSGTRRRALEYEKDLVKYWKENKTFEKSVQNRPADNAYVFYDGPPFITGVPHHGTLLSSIVKDAIPRYQTMRGHRVERVWGWDCHGLPAENFVEKKLGITDRHDIGTKISLEEYITTARESMVATAGLWEDTIDRIGRWVDFKGAYKTMDKDYMESVWWAFKQLYEKGKIYEGERVLMYDTKWATPLSKAEVTMDAGAYVNVTDPSVYVKFKLVDSKDAQVAEDSQSAGHPQPEGRGRASETESPHATYLLAWTTTPWTLPGNTAIAVNQDFDYDEVEVGGERLIIAKELVAKVLTDEKHQPIEHKVLRTLKGEELVGKSYEPLFADRGEKAHKVWHADYVSLESGSGLVHLAPAYGEEDFDMAREKGIPVVHVLDDYGVYTEGDWQGEDVWEANKPIAKALKERGVVWKIDYIQHEYPHNPRTGNRLMYRAHPSWFMDIDGQRTEMLEENTEHVTWFPEHIKHGRFEKTVQSAPDWNLSRDRFWATAMPVWKGTDENDNELVKVIGSYEELKELSGVELEDYHRPWVDDITFTIDGVEYKRIDKVLDCWFESGSMPFAQFHYPFENVEKFEQNFPGDFIVEYVGQVRAWFYYVHAVNVGLFGHNAFKNVVVTGNLMGSDGYKLSKSRGNFTDPNELMDKYSADSWRLLLLGCPVMNGEDFTLLDKDVNDTARKLTMVWNMYDFFTLYAEVDGWEFKGNLDNLLSGFGAADAGASAAPSASAVGREAVPVDAVTNPLDIWIIGRLHQLIEEVTEHMNGYDLPNATKPILPFIEDASNWYVRRSRRRFWKSGDDADKNQAYRTLHYVLTQLSLVLAPFTPFLAEELYRNLTGGESVHLLDWPKAGHINELALTNMARTRQIIEAGLGQRMQKSETEESIKVRQPLSLLTYYGDKLTDELEDIIREEVNVKTVTNQANEGPELVHLDKTLNPELLREGMMREIVRNVQNARKDAGLLVDDRILLVLTSDAPEIQAAIKEHEDTILSETLATGPLDASQAYSYACEVMVEGQTLKISFEKA